MTTFALMKSQSSLWVSEQAYKTRWIIAHKFSKLTLKIIKRASSLLRTFVSTYMTGKLQLLDSKKKKIKPINVVVILLCVFRYVKKFGDELFERDTAVWIKQQVKFIEDYNTYMCANTGGRNCRWNECKICFDENCENFIHRLSFCIYQRTRGSSQFIHKICQHSGISYHRRSQQLRYGTAQHYSAANAKHNKSHIYNSKLIYLYKAGRTLQTVGLIGLISVVSSLRMLTSRRLFLFFSASRVFLSNVFTSLPRYGPVCHRNVSHPMFGKMS